MTRSGGSYRRPTWGRRTSESGSSLWPTPRANDNDQAFRGEGSSWLGQDRGETLTNAVKRWSTPQAHDAGKGNAARVGRYGTEHGGRNLNDDVMLTTPTANRRT